MNTRIIDKVRKLLTTSADAGATPAEAQTALSIAQRLMAEHRITERDIEQLAKDEARAAGRVDADDMTTQVIGAWKIRQDGWVGMAVAAACGCGVYRSYRYYVNKKGRHTSEKALVAYGLPTDVAVCTELYAWAIQKMRDDRKAYCRAEGFRQNSIAGRSFADGWAHALLNRANQDKEERLKSKETVAVERRSIGSVETCTALIVIGEAEQLHERALAAKRKQLGIGKSSRSRSAQRDYTAYGVGGVAGARVNLSRSVVR